MKQTLADLGETDRRRLALYRELARVWNAAGIDYGVVNGLSLDGPERLGRDLDVLVERRSLEEAITITLKTMRDLGWEPVVTSRPWTTMITGIADSDGSPFSVEVDLFSSMRWFNVRLFEGPDHAVKHSTSDTIRFDPWGAFAKRVLLQILGGRTARLAQDPDRLRLRPFEEKVASTKLAALLGPTLGSAALEAVKNRDLAWLETNTSAMRRAAVARGLIHRPGQTLADSFAWASDEIHDRFLTNRAAPIVAVVGPDGIGKSSAIAELKKMLESWFRFEDVVIRHWRPRVLPALQQLRQPRRRLEMTGPSPPRREYGRFSSLRLLYYGVDFAIGHAVRDRRQASQLKLILYDRCLLDMAVDPLRYGMRSGRGVLGLWRLLPGPDIVVFIDDEVDRIRARKQELSRHELLRQLTLWREFASSGLVDETIMAGDSPDQTARRLLCPVIGAFVALGSGSED